MLDWDPKGKMGPTTPQYAYCVWYLSFILKQFLYFSLLKQLRSMLFKDNWLVFASLNVLIIYNYVLKTLNLIYGEPLFD